MAALLIAARATHYASVILLCGIFVFLFFVAEPAFRYGNKERLSASAAFRLQLLRLAWPSLAVAFASGLLWLVLQAAEMSGLPLAQALSGEIIATVLSRTQFGRDWELRLVAATLLAGWLLFRDLSTRRLPMASTPMIPMLLANGSLATLAWVGHARDSSGLAGAIHLSADAIHLLAAGAWLGH